MKHQLILKQAVVVFLLMLSSWAYAATEPEYVPGQLIIKMKYNSTSEIHLDNAIRHLNARSHHPVFSSKSIEILTRNTNSKSKHRLERILSNKRIGLDRIHLIKVNDNVDIERLAAAISKNPNVEYAKPNYYLKGLANFPNDPQFIDQYTLQNDGQTGGTVDADIDAPEAWDRETGSSNVIVAVLDEGVLTTHEDLADNIWTNSNEIPGNQIDDDGFCYSGSDGQEHCTVDDVNGWNFCEHSNQQGTVYNLGHGTHVSGIIGAVGNNMLGISGVAWDVSILSAQVLCTGFGGPLLANEVDVFAAMIYVIVQGADILNASWGGLGDRFTEQQLALLSDGFLALDEAGVLSSIAAGNFADNNNDTNPVYPANFDHPGIITVAATDDNDDLAYFSCYGPTSVDIAAPGNLILSTLSGFSINNNSSYGIKSGTSMAAPAVAGAAALVKSARPDLTSYEIKDVLLNSVDVLTSLTGLIVSDGRLNANSAVVNATSLPLTISGAITDSNGQGVSNMPLKVSSFNSFWTFTADQNGNYRTPLVLTPNAGYYLQTTDPGYSSETYGRFVAINDQPVFDVNISVKAAISGFIQNSNGEGIGGITVQISNCCGGVWYATTGNNGFYRSPYELPLGDSYYISAVVEPGMTKTPNGYFEMLNTQPVRDRNFVITY